MSYETSNLPFPSVTLCPNDRVDWNRALELESRILPNDTNQADLKTFRKILGRLSMMSFGDFDELAFLKNHNASIFSGRSFLCFFFFKWLITISLINKFVYHTFLFTKDKQIKPQKDIKCNKINIILSIFNLILCFFH